MDGIHLPIRDVSVPDGASVLRWQSIGEGALRGDLLDPIDKLEAGAAAQVTKDRRNPPRGRGQDCGEGCCARG